MNSRQIGSLKQGFVFPLIGAVGLVYLVGRPPLYDFDGYMYRLNGLIPLRKLYTVHLLWMPIQWVFWQLSFLFSSETPRFFQNMGISILCLTLGNSFRLWNEIGRDLVIASACVLFVSFSPYVWFLGTQNQPYPLLFLFIVLYLREWQKVKLGEDLPWKMSGVWLGMATLLHQAAVLLYLGAAVSFWLLDRTPLPERRRKIMAWGSVNAVIVAAAYGLAATTQSIKSLKDSERWFVGYLHTQHGLQLNLFQNGLKSVVGVLKTCLQTDSIQDKLYDYFSPKQVSLIGFSAAACMVLMGVLAFGLSSSLRRWVRQWPWGTPLFCASITLAASWALFVIVWEPINYYWAVCLFPGLTLVCLWLREGPTWMRSVVISGLCVTTIWNVYANRQVDRLASTRFPVPQLALIHRVLHPNDLLVFLGRGWEGSVDYDLLSHCLVREGISVRFLMEDFVIHHPGQWQPFFRAEIQRTLHRKGIVYASSLLLDKDAYEDMGGADFFSPYATPSYARVDEEDVRREMEHTLTKYKRGPAPLRLGSDQFFRMGI